MVTLIKYGALSGGEKYNVNVLSIDGLSTDTKPTVTYIEYGSDGREVGRMSIPNGSIFTEIDTGDTYMYDTDNTTWHKVSIGGGGGFTPTDAQLDAMNSGINSTKVAQITTNETNILLKANTSDVNTATANLQAQINQIEISASAEAVVAPEVTAARVGADGTSYQTLKGRLDAEYNALTAEQTNLKEDLTDTKDRMTQIDGIVSVAIEKGNILMTETSLSYSDSTTRLRTPQSGGVPVQTGDIIRLSSYVGTKYYVAVNDSEGHYIINGWRSSDYEVAADGVAHLLCRYEPESEINVGDLKFEVIKQNSIAKDVADLQADTSSVVQIKSVLSNDISSCEPHTGTLIDGMPSSSTIRFYTISYISVGTKKLYVSCSNNTLKFAVHKYDSDKQFIEETGWIENGNCEISSCAFVRIVVAKKSNDVITSEEIETFSRYILFSYSGEIGDLKSRITTSESGIAQNSNRIDDLGLSIESGSESIMSNITWEDGGINANTGANYSGGTAYNASHKRCAAFVPKSGKKLHIKLDSGYHMNIYQYNGDTYIGNLGWQNEYNYTIPNNVTTIRIGVVSQDDSAFVISDAFENGEMSYEYDWHVAFRNLQAECFYDLPSGFTKEQIYTETFDHQIASQGVCAHGNYLYMAMQTAIGHDELPTDIYKIDLTTNEKVETTTGTYGHCNSLAYDSENDYVVAIFTILSAPDTVFRFDAETLDEVDTVDLTEVATEVGGHLHAITYASDIKRYIAFCQHGNEWNALVFLKLDFTVDKVVKIINDGNVVQDIEYIDGLVYCTYVEEPYTDLLVIYDLKGNKITTVDAEFSGETEGITFTNNTFYALLNNGGYLSFTVYKLTVNSTAKINKVSVLSQYNLN